MQHTSFNSCVVTYKAIYYYNSTDAADCCDQVALNAKQNRVLIAQRHSALLTVDFGSYAVAFER